MGEQPHSFPWQALLFGVRTFGVQLLDCSGIGVGLLNANCDLKLKKVIRSEVDHA